MENLNSNLFSHLTAKEREFLSFPAKMLLNTGQILGDVLDFGCGFGNDCKLLREMGITVDGYDKHYFPIYPLKKYDTILCFYVLNVLTQHEQASVLIEISQLLKPTGKAFFAVRRDVLRDGFRIHKIHQKPTYQCNVRLPYTSIFRNENCEIYEYRHYNKAIDPDESACPFCFPNDERELVAESATAYAMFDKYPVSAGHVLIIPKQHCADYFQLTFKQQSACWFLLNKVKETIIKEFNPDGFNIGVNVCEAAGQTVPHVHIHLIPRYSNDVTDPRGGVRGVLPEKKLY